MAEIIKKIEKDGTESVEEFDKANPECCCKDKCESLGKSILERLDAIIEEDGFKRTVATGAAAGAIAGHHITRQNAKDKLRRANNQVIYAKRDLKKQIANTKNTINNSGAAKTIYNKEVHSATQLNKKNPTGVIGKLQNHLAKFQQKGRTQAAINNLKTDPRVGNALKYQTAAQNKYKAVKDAAKVAKQDFRAAGKLGAGRGALIGGAALAGVYGLNKLRKKNN